MEFNSFWGREVLHMIASPYVYIVTFVLLEWMYRQKWYKKRLSRPKGWFTFLLPGIPWNIFLVFFEIQNAGHSVEGGYPWWKSYVDIVVWNIFMYGTAYVLYRLAPRLMVTIREIKKVKS